MRRSNWVVGLGVVMTLAACSGGEADGSSSMMANSSGAAGGSSGTGSSLGNGLDQDFDGIRDSADNCVGVSNANQMDWDDDNVGDACDFGPSDKKVYSITGVEFLATQTPKTELSSTLDVDGNTHVVWHHDIADGASSLRYAKVTELGVITQADIAIPGDPERTLVGDIVVDDSGKVHIVVIVKRDIDAGTREGNYAIYYAGGSGGAFTVNQVSTNPTDPTIKDSTQLYNAYVNDRPQIALKGSSVVVLYTADANGETDYDNWMILAESGDGSHWEHTQAFNADDLGVAIDGKFKTYSQTGDVSAKLPREMGDYDIIALMDITDYNPRFLAGSGDSWQETLMAGPFGFTDAGHPQIQKDDAGVNHYFYHYNNGDGDSRYLHSTVGSEGYSPFTDIPAPGIAGNYAPATIDRADGSQWYFIYRKSSDDNEYYIHVDATKNETVSTSFDVPGARYGEQSLEVVNKYLSYVTYDSSTKSIVVTRFRTQP